MATKKAEELNFTPSKKLAILGGLMQGIGDYYNKQKEAELAAQQQQAQMMRALMPVIARGEMEMQKLTVEQAGTLQRFMAKLGIDVSEAEKGRAERREQWEAEQEVGVEERKESRERWETEQEVGAEEREAAALARTRSHELAIKGIDADLLQIKNEFTLGARGLDIKEDIASMENRFAQLSIDLNAMKEMMIEDIRAASGMAIAKERTESAEKIAGEALTQRKTEHEENLAQRKEEHTDLMKSKMTEDEAKLYRAEEQALDRVDRTFQTYFVISQQEGAAEDQIKVAADAYTQAIRAVNRAIDNANAVRIKKGEGTVAPYVEISFEKEDRMWPRKDIWRWEGAAPAPAEGIAPAPAGEIAPAPAPRSPLGPPAPERPLSAGESVVSDEMQEFIRIAERHGITILSIKERQRLVNKGINPDEVERILKEREASRAK